MRFFPLLLIAVSSVCLAQAAKPAARFSSHELVIEANGTTPVPPCSEAADKKCFDPHAPNVVRVYELLDADTPEVRTRDISDNLLMGSIDFAAPIQQITATLKPGSQKLIKPGSTYFIRVAPYPTASDSSTPGQLLIKVDIAGSIAPGKDAAKPRTEVGLLSPVVLTSDGVHPLHDTTKGGTGSPVSINKKVTRIKNDDLSEGTKTIPGTVTAIVNNTYFVGLSKKLDQNSSNSLTAQLKDESNSSITLKGSVDIQGAPADDKNARINLKLGSTAAVHQKAVFTLSGTFAPLHSDIRPTTFFDNSVIWDPSVTVDVGLRSTKSADSIIFGNAFRHIFPFSVKSCPCPGTCKYCASPTNKIPTYFRTRHQSFRRLSDISFTWTLPSLETDREFDKLNVVSQMRSEFGLYRLRQSTTDQQHYLAVDLDKKQLATVTGLDWGFSLIPYLQLTAGGQPMDQVVTNIKAANKPSVTVPAFGILRGYAGILLELDVPKFTFSVDESFIGLALKETAGFTTDKGVGMRTVQGAQHHGKASIDYLLDRGKHYRFSLAYENGRTPPLFEYLNKGEVGFKVVY